MRLRHVYVQHGLVARGIVEPAADDVEAVLEHDERERREVAA